MAPNRITRGRAVLRALPFAAALVLLALAFTACGGGEPPSKSEAEMDAKVLNEVLGRQLAAVDAYGRVLPNLRGADLVAARQFRAQEQEHVDATTKTLRGIGAEADPPAETVSANELQTRTDNLEFLYEMESATIDAELSAVPRQRQQRRHPLPQRHHVRRRPHRQQLVIPPEIRRT